MGIGPRSFAPDPTAPRGPTSLASGPRPYSRPHSGCTSRSTDVRASHPPTGRCGPTHASRTADDTTSGGSLLTSDATGTARLRPAIATVRTDRA